MKFDLEKRKLLLEMKMRKYIQGINLASNKQLSKLLYEDLNYKPLRITGTGQGQVNIEAVTELIGQKPKHDDFLVSLLEWKHVDADLTKFFDKYDMEIFIAHHVCGTETGRTTCEKYPGSKGKGGQMQQFPSKYLFELVDGIKEKFDWPQLELRVGAFISKEPTLISLYKKGQDVHNFTKSIIAPLGITIPPAYHTSPDTFRRRVAKCVNFCLFYSGTEYALRNVLLSGGINIPIKQCEKIMNIVKRKAFPNIQKYYKGILDRVLEKGYVEIPTGRKKHFNVEGLEKHLFYKVWREAVNAPVQGMASDIALSGCVDLWKEGILDMLIFRHDEADHRGWDEKTRAKAKEILQECLLLKKLNIDFPIPIIVDMETLK